MTPEIIFMLVLMGLALVAFIREMFPLEVTALAVLAILVATRTIEIHDALSGFSSTAAVTVGSLFVLSRALTKTGLLETVADRAGRAARNKPWTMIVVLLVAVCAGSGVLNNTAVVALSIPLVLKLCRQLQLSPSKVLLPLSYASILGGTLTLVGTSTNLLVNSIIVDSGREPLRMFEFTAMGGIVAAIGLVYIVAAARPMLAARAAAGDLTGKYRVEGFLTELKVEADSKMVGHNLSETRCNERYGVTVLEVVRKPSETHVDDAGTVSLQPDDLLIVQGELEDILRLQREQQLAIVPDVEFAEDTLVAGGQSLVEAWVAPGSRMIGRNLKQLDFHHNYGAFVLAIRRVRSTLRRRVADVILRSGDALLVLIPQSRLPRLEETGDIVVFSEHEVFLHRDRGWWLAIMVLPAVVLVAATGLLSIAAAALVGSVLLVVTGVMTPREAHRAINWPVVFMIAAFVPVGRAFQVTGTADFLAESVLSASAWAPADMAPYVVLAMIYLVATAITQMASNNAAAVVITPIALSLGPALGVDSRPFVIAVCFAASAAFMTPMGYQTNLMVHSAGRYRFRDYVRFGAPLNLIAWVLSVLLIPVFWPF
jgi:di/tricarboxylate transporter